VRTIEVSVTSSDQSLNLETRESYTLDVASPAIVIQANSVFGALRALESLSQMLRRRSVLPGSALEALVPPEAIWPAEEEGAQGGEGGDAQGAGAAASGAGGDLPQRRRRKKKDKTVLLVEEVDIYDAPRFRYRGLLIDTARHFLPVSVIKTHLDAMTMVKMNVLHWHLTDDQSFPWQTEELPELAERGSFAPEAVYTPADIKEVVRYARFRGVRVIPELDTPGHTASWGKAYPELLTRCYDTAAGRTGEPPEPSDKLGPINPARNETYGFLWRLIREATRSFPDPYLHLGGDEVEHECWKSNPEVQAFMTAQKWGDDFARLEGYYMQQVIQLAASAGRAPIVWQEAYDRGVKLPAGTRVRRHSHTLALSRR
jgi:hexosaminidase